jgi:hypothetical protein
MRDFLKNHRSKFATSYYSFSVVMIERIVKADHKNIVGDNLAGMISIEVWFFSIYRRADL